MSIVQRGVIDLNFNKNNDPYVQFSINVDSVWFNQGNDILNYRHLRFAQNFCDVHEIPLDITDLAADYISKNFKD